MFTLKQINGIHKRFGKKTTLPQYLHALKTIGVIKYDSFVTDGHSEYYGNDSQIVVSLPLHEKFKIIKTSNKESMLTHLSLHQQGKTSYIEMSKGFN